MSSDKKQRVVTVRMPAELHARLTDEKWARRISLNRLCVLLLSGEPLPERCVPEGTFALDEIRGALCTKQTEPNR